MPKPLLIIAITIAMLLPVQREAPSVVGARTFVSNEGRFSIALPGVNGFGSLTIPTPFDEAKGDLYQWRTREATFGIGYADASQPLDQPEIAKTFFKSATERFNKAAISNSGSIAAVKQITLDKHPGIEQRVDLFTGTVIQRTYIVSRRIYEIVAVMKNEQRVYENVALGVLNTFKVLSEAEVNTSLAEEAAKAEPSPLPQTPVVKRTGSDASDKGLRGRVRTVLTESQDLSGSWSVQGKKRNSFDTYNEQGNTLRSELYDYKGNLDSITVYGFIDGSRVSASQSIEREYNPPPMIAVGPPPGAPTKRPDPRYGYKYEFKYDDKKRLIENTWLQSSGEVWLRYVYKYNGNRKEKLVYSEDGKLNQHYLYILDDKGNEIAETYFNPDGSVRLQEVFTYEFDANGNWTKRTTSRLVMKNGREQTEPYSVYFRTITYY